MTTIPASIHIRVGLTPGLFQLHLEPLYPDLVAIHSLNGAASRYRIIVAHKTEALAQVRVLVDENLSREHLAEGGERLRQIQIAKLARQVINEQIAAVGAFLLLEAAAAPIRRQTINPSGQAQRRGRGGVHVQPERIARATELARAEFARARRLAPVVQAQAVEVLVQVVGEGRRRIAEVDQARRQIVVGVGDARRARAIPSADRAEREVAQTEGVVVVVGARCAGRVGQAAICGADRVQAAARLR